VKHQAMQRASFQRHCSFSGQAQAQKQAQAQNQAQEQAQKLRKMTTDIAIHLSLSLAK
jgi:hypothetical protein